MTPIDIQVSRSKVKVKGHASLLYLILYMLGKGGISVLQTSIFNDFSVIYDEKLVQMHINLQYQHLYRGINRTVGKLTVDIVSNSG